MEAGGAPARTSFLNFNSFDRFRRQGIVVTFNEATKQYHYDGSAWREIVRRHAGRPETEPARARLGALPARHGDAFEVEIDRKRMMPAQ